MLTLPTDGSEDTQAKVLLLSQEIDSRLLQPMTLHRLAELRKEITNLRIDIELLKRQVEVK